VGLTPDYFERTVELFLDSVARESRNEPLDDVSREHEY
jgi:hypothetical protein